MLPRLVICILAFIASLSSVYAGDVKLVRMKSSGSDTLKSRDFVYENDSFRISYDFWNGAKPELQVSVFNKLPMPLCLNLAKSAYVINDKVLHFSPDPEQGALIYIIPHTSIVRRIMIGGAESAFEKTGTGVKEITPASWTADSSQKTMVYRYKFSKDNTPLYMRVYLTLTYSRPEEKEIYKDYEFYADEMLRMNEKQFNGRMTGMDSQGNYKYDNIYMDNKAFYILEE